MVVLATSQPRNRYKCLVTHDCNKRCTVQSILLTLQCSAPRSAGRLIMPWPASQALRPRLVIWEKLALQTEVIPHTSHTSPLVIPHTSPLVIPHTSHTSVSDLTLL